MADLPGLIEGASNNRGLGHAFLKHTEKAKALALVVSSRLCKKKKEVGTMGKSVFFLSCCFHTWFDKNVKCS